MLIGREGFFIALQAGQSSTFTIPGTGMLRILGQYVRKGGEGFFIALEVEECFTLPRPGSGVRRVERQRLLDFI